MNSFAHPSAPFLRTHRGRAARLCLGALLLGVACALTLGSAGADETTQCHDRFEQFFPTGRYQVFANGKEVQAASVLYSRAAGALLVQDTPYATPFLIDLRERTVHRVDAVEILPRDGVTCVDLRASSALTKIGVIRLERGDILIDVENLVARLNLRGELIGLLSSMDLLEHSPEYGRDAENYLVDAKLIARLASLEQDAEVVVYFGTWCHTCKRLLGRVLRVEQELADSHIRFRYYGVPKPPAMYRDEAVRRDNVRKLPTGMILVSGQNTGSIVSMALSRPESALVQILVRGTE